MKIALLSTVLVSTIVATIVAATGTMNTAGAGCAAHSVMHLPS